MSTVKNYDAENFTSSEIEIKSGQNYDIKFKNAISGQIDWNVSGDNIAVNVYKTKAVHTTAYRSYEYEKTEYGNKALNTEVLEKKVVTVDANPLTTKHSYVLVTQNATSGYDVCIMEEIRAQDENGVWANDLSDAVQKEDSLVNVADLTALKANSTYGTIFAEVTDITTVLGEEHVTAYGTDQTASVYTTTIYEATTKEGDEWQFGDAVSSFKKSQPETPVTEGPTYAKVKYTQAWDAEDSDYGERTEVTNGRTEVDDIATATLLPTKYIYSMTIAEYDFDKEEFGEAAAQNDLSVETQLEHLTVYTRTSTKENYTTPVEGENLDQYTAFETYLQDNSATTDVIQLALDENSKKVVLGTLTLKNAATLGQDYNTYIGLTATGKNGDVIIGYPDDEYDIVEPHNLKTNDYTITGVPDKETTPTKYTFTGTSLNENAESTAIADTFQLGTGNNTINIDVASDFGHDTVIGTEGEYLTVNFANFNAEQGYSYEVTSSGENDENVVLTIKKTGTGENPQTVTQGSVTFKGLNEKNVFGYSEPSVVGLGDDFTLFNDGQITGEVDTTDSTKATFTGTWRADYAVSGATNDTFDLKTGNDEIDFNVYENFGKDTVVANKGEILELNFNALQDKTVGTGDDAVVRDFAKIEVKGSDVVATTKAEYYATIKVDKDYVVDGYLANLSGTFDESKYKQNILNKLTDVKYDLKTDATATSAITKEAYDKLDDTNKDLYQFKEGTLKLTLQNKITHYKADDSEAKKAYFNKTLFATDALYQLDDNYKNTFNAESSQDVRIGIDNEDILALTSGTEGVYVPFGTTNTADPHMDFVKLTDLHIYESINGAKAVEVTSEYRTMLLPYSEALVTAANYDALNVKLLSAATASTVTVKDALTSGAYVTVDGKTVTANAYAIDTMNEDIKEQMKAANTLFEAEDVVAKSKKGKLDLSKATNDKIISLTGYVSENGKGANIITKAGNDTIVGSDYNDTLNLKAGNNIVSEAAGTNKITTGKGDDVITISNYASATIKTSGGNNEINLDSIGTNKFTGGNGVDTVNIGFGGQAAAAGVGINTVKAGKGTLVAQVASGNNNITGGKKADDIRITDGLNKINAGAGDDYLIVKGGHNTITLGKGNDEIVIDDELVNAPSNNIIKGTAGNNKYTINGGQNVITGGKNVDEFIFSGASDSFVNGGKGNDIYNLKDYDFEDGALSIKDTKGKNTVVLSGSKDDYDVYFNVTAKKNKKGVVSLKSIGKTLELSNEDGTVSITTDGKTAKNGTLSNLKVSADSDYSVNVKKVANEVVAWLSSSANDTGLLSTDAIFASSGNDAAKAALQGIYNGNGYTDANNNVIAAQVNMFV